MATRKKSKKNLGRSDGSAIFSARIDRELIPKVRKLSKTTGLKMGALTEIALAMLLEEGDDLVATIKEFAKKRKQSKKSQ